jgi:predicted transcriptional regulator
MARAPYPRELSEKDPLRTLHIKIPTSGIATLNRYAQKLDRSTAWVVREALMEYVVKLRKDEQKRA